MYKLGRNRKTPDVSPNLKNWKFSTVVHSPPDWCDWIPKESKLDVISLLIFGGFSYNKGRKGKKKKEKVKTVKNSFYFQKYLLAGNIKNYPLQKPRKWNSLQIICTTKALSYWTFLQWASLSCSQTAFQEFWALEANRTEFTCPCHFYHMWTQTHSQRNVKNPEDTKGCSFSIALTSLCLFKPFQI